MAVEKAAVRAVQKGEPEAAAAAVKAAGGWTTALTRNGDTALHLAAAFDRPQVLRLALAAVDPREVDRRNKVGHAPLHEAALASSVECVIILLTIGASVDILKHADWTPLHLACTKTSFEVVDMLLKAGAQTQLQNKDGWTPFHVACKTGHVPIVQRLLEADPSAARLLSTTQRTPLMTASLNGNAGVCEVLLRAGFDPNERDSCGWTALHWAAAGAHADVLKILLAAGADIESRDEGGRLALHACAQAGDGGEYFESTPEMAAAAIAVLLTYWREDPKRGSCWRADSNGLTPLHLAAGVGQRATVELLLTEGASPAANDVRGRTPADIAEGHKHTQLATRLRDACLDAGFGEGGEAA